MTGGTLNAYETDIGTYTSDGNLKQRQEWTLDALGNWGTNAVRVSGTTLTETRTHNRVNEYLASSGSGLPSITFAHDDNGNITDDGTYLYEYDMENRLTRVKLKSNSDVIAVYRYDALGRRVRKIVTNSGGLNGTYHEVQSPDWQLLEIRHDAGTNEVLDQEFVYASAAPPSGGRGVGSGYIDDRVAYWSSGTLRYYHCDAQYCTLALTATTGTPITIAERYVTDPYGKAVVYNADWSGARATSNCGNPFMHQGLRLDAEILKYQNRHRMLMADLGRFGQRDPLGMRAGHNLYAYLSSGPEARIDPLGLDCALTCEVQWTTCRVLGKFDFDKCSSCYLDCVNACIGNPNSTGEQAWATTACASQVGPQSPPNPPPPAPVNPVPCGPQATQAACATCIACGGLGILTGGATGKNPTCWGACSMCAVCATPVVIHLFSPLDPPPLENSAASD